VNSFESPNLKKIDFEFKFIAYCSKLPMASSDNYQSITTISKMLELIGDELISHHLQNILKSSKVEMMDSEKLLEFSRYSDIQEVRLLRTLEELVVPKETEEKPKKSEETKEEPEETDEERAELDKILSELDSYSEPDSSYDSECDEEPYDYYWPEDEV
jgi:hypothetical protein